MLVCAILYTQVVVCLTVHLFVLLNFMPSFQDGYILLPDLADCPVKVFLSSVSQPILSLTSNTLEKETQMTT